MEFLNSKFASAQKELVEFWNESVKVEVIVKLLL